MNIPVIHNPVHTRFVNLTVLAAVAVTASACAWGSASVVRRDQYGGTLSLRGHQGAAMEDAHGMMASHCQGPYTVISEEQVVVGQQTQTGSDSNYDNDETGTAGSQNSTTTTTTSNVTEYHVTYQCGGNGAQPAPSTSGGQQPVAEPTVVPLEPQPNDPAIANGPVPTADPVEQTQSPSSNNSQPAQPVSNEVVLEATGSVQTQ